MGFNLEIILKLNFDRPTLLCVVWQCLLTLTSIKDLCISNKLVV